ncbi:MAG: aspartate aminotransferase family protein [Ruminococcaceae bacterium]|nr:aspartate aminotransferase family protein [Oscillospiraceae bacterium]
MDIRQYDKNYIMPTYGRFDMVAVRGEGARVYDENDREYIDFSSGIGVSSLGYGDSKWAKAVADQAATLAHISNLFYSKPMELVAKKLIEASGLSKVFFGNSGAEANECAIKLARKYSFDKYGENRNTIITLRQSFHGRTLTTLSATGQDVFHNFFFPFTEGFRYAAANDIDALKAELDDTVCAIMMEGIQGEGGVFPLTDEYVSAVAAICAEKDILLIFDEVQTGIGRTGKMFCFEHFSAVPDIVTLAKGLGGGLPIGACLCNEKLALTMGAGTHGSTFGGNPVSCAGANAVLDRVGNADFLADVTKKGEYIRAKIAQANIPAVKAVRGKGLMIGIDIGEHSPKQVVKTAVENGLLVLSAGKSAVRLLPPLVITYEEIDKGLAILCDILNELK